MKLRQFIIKQLAADAGSVKVAIIGLTAALLSNPLILDHYPMSEAERIAVSTAIGTGVAWLLTTIAAYYQNQGVKEIQQTLNKVSNQLDNPPLKVDGVAGEKVIATTKDTVAVVKDS